MSTTQIQTADARTFDDWDAENESLKQRAVAEGLREYSQFVIARASNTAPKIDAADVRDLFELVGRTHNEFSADVERVEAVFRSRDVEKKIEQLQVQIDNSNVDYGKAEQQFETVAQPIIDAMEACQNRSIALHSQKEKLERQVKPRTRPAVPDSHWGTLAYSLDEIRKQHNAAAKHVGSCESRLRSAKDLVERGAGRDLSGASLPAARRAIPELESQLADANNAAANLQSQIDELNQYHAALLACCDPLTGIFIPVNLPPRPQVSATAAQRDATHYPGRGRGANRPDDY